MSWYHLSLRTDEATKLLQEKGSPGSYLVTQSTWNAGCYDLLILTDNEKVVKLFRIQRHSRNDESESLLYSMLGVDFRSLSTLIDYFRKEGINSDGIKIQLKQPLNSEVAFNARWYHPNISGKEAENQLLNEFKNIPFGSYLVRQSRNQPGAFALSVKLDAKPPSTQGLPSVPKVFHFMIAKDSRGSYTLKGTDLKGYTPTIESLLQLLKENPLKVDNIEICLTQPLAASSVQANIILKRINELKNVNELNKTGFEEEYDTIQNDVDLDVLNQKYSTSIAVKPENITKNRFQDNYPFDSNRIVLNDGCGLSNYINASPIPLDVGGGKVKTYIACQGPLPNTVEDFWRLIWYCKANIIVMLTNLVEKNIVTCKKYWPDLNKIQKFPVAHLEVVNYSSTPFNLAGTPLFVHSLLHVRQSNTGEERTIHHLHFVAWPDSGVPSSISTIRQFLCDIQRIESKCASHIDPPPVIVHCSTGGGRTGTIIAIDSIIRKINQEGITTLVDIKETVYEMRRHRQNMVQSVLQYTFIYESVLEYICSISAS